MHILRQSKNRSTLHSSAQSWHVPLKPHIKNIHISDFPWPPKLSTLVTAGLEYCVACGLLCSACGFDICTRSLWCDSSSNFQGAAYLIPNHRMPLGDPPCTKGGHKITQESQMQPLRMHGRAIMRHQQPHPDCRCISFIFTKCKTIISGLLNIGLLCEDMPLKTVKCIRWILPLPFNTSEELQGSQGPPPPFCQWTGSHYDQACRAGDCVTPTI